MRTRITERFGVERPIVLGGMYTVGYAELASAVSDAAGLGLITALTQPSPERLREEIARCRDMTDTPLGVKVTFLPSAMPPDNSSYIRMIAESGVEPRAGGKRPGSGAARAQGGRLQGDPQVHLRATCA